ADHLAVVDGNRARRTRPEPRVDDLGIFDVLLEECAVALRDPLEEAVHRALVARIDRSDLHHLSFGASSSALWATIQSLRAGSVWLKATFPVAKVTWPPRSRSSSRRPG